MAAPLALTPSLDEDKKSIDLAPEVQPEQEGKVHKIFGSSSTAPPRTLKSRHLTLLSIGGTIGTGIFFSLGSSVATAGAGGALVSYILVGLFCLGVVLTLGEMSAFTPVSGSFATFGSRYVSPALGFTLGWSYWLQWSFSIPSELIAASTILSYWTDALNTWQWSLVIIVPVFAFQFLGTRAWGEAEFYLAFIKVILIVMFIIVGLIYDWGGIRNHPGPGLSNFNDGTFNGGFAGTAQSFTYAFYSFGGVELVTLAAGETASPHKAIPRAIRGTFARIVLFYVLTCLVIGLCINHQDPTLFTAYNESDVSASPITTVFKLAGFGAAVHVVNAVLLTAVLSATNSCFYASSRMLLSLARQGDAPKVFSWVTKRGVPVPALLVTLAISFFSFLTAVWGSGKAFTWLISVTGILALVTWLSIAIINIRFRLAFKKQGRSLDDLPFKAPLSPFLAIWVILLGILMLAANGWAPTTYGDTPSELAKAEVAVWIGLAYFLVLYVGFSIHQKLTSKTPHFVPLAEVDLVSGAVWGPGGGREWRESEKLEKAAIKQSKGTQGYMLGRVKEALLS
ncbi:amino acid permease [Sporobolomyces koalae]|uniref:amino acid permease n=1 Tax=Sporobolomyces koalae TaxID=500713 RepID=UPI0031748A34